MDERILSDVIEQAWAVRQKAYAPYSKFQVGAVIVTKSGKRFAGCNVENLSYGLTNCAERVAVGAMIAAGEREIDTVVVVADTREPISPCGACRQVLAEFGECKLVLAAQDGKICRFQLSELLPRAATGILDRD
jgi:cytidine deaminase